MGRGLGITYLQSEMGKGLDITYLQSEMGRGFGYNLFVLVARNG